MILWALLTLMIAVTVAGLTVPLVRRADARPARGTTLGVLKDQLRDLDAQEGPDADGWVRLMRARIVLGETDKAAAAYRDARKAFADDPAQLSALAKSARELGVTGA